MNLLGKKREKEKQNSEPTSSSSFLIKLYSMLNEEKYSKYIRWSDDGLSLIIVNQIDFVNNVLPHYFNHKNIASFTRQLNLYNFRTIKTDKKDEHHYMHDKFNKWKSLEQIKKIQKKDKIDEDKKIDLTNINLGGINLLEEKNEIIEKKENLEEETKIKNIEKILKEGELSNDTKIILNYLFEKSKEYNEKQKNSENQIKDLIVKNNYLIEQIKLYNNKLNIDKNNSAKMKGMILYLMKKNNELKYLVNKKFVQFVNKYREFKNNNINFNYNYDLAVPKIEPLNPNYTFGINNINECKFTDTKNKYLSLYMNGGGFNIMKNGYKINPTNIFIA